MQLGLSKRYTAHRHLMLRAHPSPSRFLEHWELIHQTFSSSSSSHLLAVEHRRAWTKPGIQRGCFGLKTIHQGLKAVLDRLCSCWGKTSPGGEKKPNTSEEGKERIQRELCMRFSGEKHIHLWGIPPPCAAGAERGCTGLLG